MPGKNPWTRFQRECAIEQPAFLSKSWVWLVTAAVLVIPFFLPIAQSLRRHPLIGALGDQLHIPLLAGLTLLIYWRGPLRGRLWWAAGSAAVAGGLIEFIQTLVGRSAKFEDWLLDLVGISLVVGLVLWRGQSNKWGKRLLIALLLYIPAQLWFLPFTTLARYEARQTFPLLADFDGRHHRWLWDDTNGSWIGFAFADSVHGQVLQLHGGPERSWPGARMTKFPEKWSHYTRVVLDVRVAAGPRDSVRFGVRIDDWEGRKDNQWASQSFWATRDWQTRVMRITDRKVIHGDRHLDLGDVESLLVFAYQPPDSFTLEVDNIRLE